MFPVTAGPALCRMFQRTEWAQSNAQWRSSTVGEPLKIPSSIWETNILLTINRDIRFTESQNQEIANPEVKEIKTKVSGIKAKLAALYKKFDKEQRSSQ